MTVLYSGSAASGNITNAMYDVAIGPFRCFTAHYSAPSATSGEFIPGMNRVIFVHVEDADAGAYSYTANSAGGINVIFSGHASGSTGYMFVLGF